MDDLVHEFPPLDFTKLLDPDNDFAVRMPNEAAALHFIREVRRQYPDHSWHHDDTKWSEDYELAYSPYLNRDCKTMTWDGVGHYKRLSFVILDFTDLFPEEEENDLQEGDKSIEFLFGAMKIASN